MTQQPLTEVAETLSDGIVVSIYGDIDLQRSPDLRIALIQHTEGSHGRLIVDLTSVSYMDSSGVATLVEVLQYQCRSGGSLILCNLQPNVQSIFEISKLDSVFNIVPDIDTARTA